MSGIDERILAMKFDNKQFEQGVGQSLNTLDKLNKGLKMEGASKGVTDLSNKIKNLPLDGISRGVETVANKFNLMSLAGITAIQNITNRVVDMGVKIAKAFTIDPIKTGFQEYETQLNAIQTILANTQSKGSTLKDVNSALAELNAYSDKTVYNFTEMTRNIGSFTAAGVDLKTSTAAIKGIANLAAVSGSNSQQASTAMYQLSQALSSGTVKLQDWNSVVNAGMGGQVFQDALKETARAHGVKIDEMIKKEGSFRETLQKGWLTSKILTETLSKFTGDLSAEQLKSMGYSEPQIEGILKLGKTASDAATKVKTFTQLGDTLKEAVQSGWAQTWQIFVGDFEEAKELYTNISDVVGGFIGKTSDARNEVLQGWKDLGGRKALIDAFTNAFKFFVDVANPIGKAFSKMFPPITAKTLVNITNALRDFTSRLKVSAESADLIKRTFMGVFAIFRIGFNLIKAVAGGIASIFPTSAIKSFASEILPAAAKMGDFLVRLNQLIESGKLMDKIYERFPGLKKFADNLDRIMVLFSINETLTSVFETIKKIKDVDVSGAFIFIDKIKAKLAPLKEIGPIVSKFFENVIGVFQRTMPVLVSWWNKLVALAKDAVAKVKEVFGGFNINDAANGLNVGLLVMIGGAIYKFIKSLTSVTDNAGGFIASIKDMFGGVTSSLQALQANLKAKTLMEIAKAIALLTASMFVLALIDSDKLTKSLTAMTVMFVQLFGSMLIFEKLTSGKDFGGMLKVTTAMILLGVALNLLTAAVVGLSKLSWGEIAKGLTATIVLMGSMIAMSALVDKNSKGLIKAGVGLILFSGAIRIMAGAVEKLGAIDSGSLTKGLLSIGVILTLLAGFTKLVNPAKLVATSVSMVVLSGALRILSSVVSAFGEMDDKVIMKGLISIGAVLLLLAGFTTAVNPAKLVSTAIAMTILGAAMAIFTSVMERMAKMSIDEIARSLAMLAGTLLILTVASTAMKDSVGAALAITAIAGALLLLLPVLQAFSQMSIEEIAKALGVLAGVFIVFGVAGIVLGKLSPILLALAGAMALFGLAVLAAGVGVLAFATGIAVLGAAFATGGAAVIAGILALIALIPYFMVAVAVGIVAFAGVIRDGAPTIGEAFLSIFVTMLKVIATVTPLIMDVLGLLLGKLLDLLVKYVPKMVDAGMKIIIGLLEGIEKNIGKIVDTGTNIVTKFMDAVSAKLPSLAKSGADLIISFINSVANEIRNSGPRLGDAGGNLATAIIDGLAGGLRAGVGRVVDSAKRLAQDAINAAKDIFAVKSPSRVFAWLGKQDALGLAMGMDKYSKVSAKSAENMGEDAIEALKQSMSGITNIFSGNLEGDPTIRPVIDMSAVDSGLNSIRNKFGSERLNVSASFNRANESVPTPYGQTENAGGVEIKSTSGAVLNYTQNNYSPKALSRLEIYRNTRNQLESIKEVVNQP